MVRRLGMWALLIAVAVGGCGDDDDGGFFATPDRDGGRREDSGGELEFDGDVPLPFVPDAGTPIPGEPPPELADSVCAVDTNKLYEVVTLDRPAAPVQLGVDLAQAHFGAAFIGDSDECIDALFMADLHGASGVGEPEVTLISDACTTVTHTAITHSGERWLLAVVDARMDSYDVWVQGYDAENEFPPYRISENLGHESDLAISAVGDRALDTRAAMAAWVERDPDSGATSLNVRPLSITGEPIGDAVVLEPAGTYSFASVSLSGIGSDYAALAYRRTDANGTSEIVLDVLLNGSGERDRDPWVLTSEAGAFGSVELATDNAALAARSPALEPRFDEGGAVIYTIDQVESQQLWFQALDSGGRAAPVRSGTQIGDPSAPTRVVAPPHKALDASLVKLPAGYAVAYRAMPGGMVDSPRIRVHFLDRMGTVRAVSDVALASEFGGRTAIEAAFDGRIVLGWTDTEADGMSTLTIAKLPCVGN